ncbi:hypothetical protein PENTCL1PPCAC_18037, partial [Pristionchus entomophagus]
VVLLWIIVDGWCKRRSVGVLGVSVLPLMKPLPLALSTDDPSTTHPSTMSGSSMEGPSSSGGSVEMQGGDQSSRDDGLYPSLQPILPHSSVPATASDLICNPLRTMVSQNRRRYHDDGFNLDLTYITDRIIAMGYPADTKEAIYRNSMESTVQFLEYYHKGHYKVFNLRGQYVYDTKKFHDRVLSFEMVDHHPPRLESWLLFVERSMIISMPILVISLPSTAKRGKGRTE